jgi:hypothetical protein
MVESKSKEAKLSVLIVAKDLAEADSNHAHFKSAHKNLSVKSTFVGDSTTYNRFEAVIIVAGDQDDLDLMSDALVRYHNCPVVAFAGEGIKPDEEFLTAKVMKKEAVADFVTAECEKVKAQIKTIFDSFDTDKSGFIDKDELKGVAAGLGLEMGNVEAENMVRDLDLNKDGKISPDEFNLWWLAGRKGSTGTMSQLLAAKFSSGFFGNLGDSMKELAKQAQSGAYKTKKSSVELNFNGNNEAKSQDGLQVFYRSQLFGQSTTTAINELKSRCTGSKESDDFIFMSVTVKLAEGFEDKHGFFEAFNNCSVWKAARDKNEPIPNFNVQFNDGKLNFTMSMKVPTDEVEDLA